jgi:hypothetical protein
MQPSFQDRQQQQKKQWNYSTKQYSRKKLREKKMRNGDLQQILVPVPSKVGFF